MAKRSKLKKVLSPTPSSPPEAAWQDDDLMDDLMAQLDSRDPNTQAESAAVLEQINLSQQDAEIGEETSRKQDAKSRYQARQMRKAAALAESHSPDDPAADARRKKEADAEEAAIAKTCDALGLRIREINPDGHCLFSAIADQLSLLSIIPSSEATYPTTRHAAANYIFGHPDDFLPFLPSAEGEDGTGATDTGLMSPKNFEKYCATMRDTGIWGGEPEILALSRVYNVPIHVVQGGNPPIVVHSPPGGSTLTDKHTKAVRISYHRRMYGLGEHYNSLHKKGLTDKIHDALT